MLAVAVASRPADFEGDAEAPDGSAWELFGELYPTNPRLLLTDADFQMLRFWRLYQGGGYGGGHLPDDGGVMDQAAIMLDAFDVMTVAARALREEHGRRSRSRTVH